MITAVVLTKNEQESIQSCIKSISFCDEILVIDDFSTDETTKLARKLGATIYKRKLQDNFSEQRNFGLGKAQHEWVLFVDSDERVSKELANEIIQITSNPLHSFVGMCMKRIDEMWGTKIMHGECGAIKLLRLAKKDSGIWEREVHEVWNVSGKTHMLKNPLLHYPHKTLREFISDVNTMATIHAHANQKERKKSNILKIIFYPPLKFIYNYIFKMGFRDGTAGFMIAALMSFHSFLAWSNLWLTQKAVDTKQ